MKRAAIVCIEGADRHGKTTQSKHLLSALIDEGLCPELIKVPYDDGFTHRLIYSMLADGRAKRYKNAFQFMNFVNKLMFQLFVLPFKLFKNDVIILDRWKLSSIVYGTCDGADPSFCRLIQRFLLAPDATFVLTGEGFQRTDADCYEDDVDFQRRVNDMYERMAASRSDCYGIDAQLGRDVVHERILGCVLELLGKRGKK